MQTSLLSIDQQLDRLVSQQYFSMKMKTLEGFKKKQVYFSNESKLLNGQMSNDLDKRLSMLMSQESDARKEIDKLKDVEQRLEVDSEHKHRIVQTRKTQLQEVNQKRFDLQISTDSLQSKIKSLNIDQSVEEEQIWSLSKLSDKELVTNLKKTIIAKLKYTLKDKANFDKLEEYFQAHNQYNTDLKDLLNSKKNFQKLLSNLFLNISQN